MLLFLEARRGSSQSIVIVLNASFSPGARQRNHSANLFTASVCDVTEPYELFIDQMAIYFSSWMPFLALTAVAPNMAPLGNLEMVA